MEAQSEGTLAQPGSADTHTASPSVPAAVADEPMLLPATGGTCAAPPEQPQGALTPSFAVAGSAATRSAAHVPVRPAGPSPSEPSPSRTSFLTPLSWLASPTPLTPCAQPASIDLAQQTVETEARSLQATSKVAASPAPAEAPAAATAPAATPFSDASSAADAASSCTDAQTRLVVRSAGDALAPVTHMYHERQLSALCGVHALNNLLQGPYFGAGDLAEIAAALDARERELFAEGSGSGGCSGRSGGGGGEVGGGGSSGGGGSGSHHVDTASGDFSIEVLQAALEPRGLRLVNWENAAVLVDVAAKPHEEGGFLCHSSSHWFALRSLVGLWFNCDSRLPRPRLISETHLSACLEALRAEGHTVHIVRGTDDSLARLPLPPPVESTSAAGREDVWHPIEYLLLHSADEGDGVPMLLASASGDNDRMLPLAPPRLSEEEEKEAAAAAMAVACQAEEDDALAAQLMAEEIEAAEIQNATAAAQQQPPQQPQQRPPPTPTVVRADGSRPGYFTQLGARLDDMGESVAAWFRQPPRQAAAPSAAATSHAADPGAPAAPQSCWSNWFSRRPAGAAGDDRISSTASGVAPLLASQHPGAGGGGSAAGHFFSLEEIRRAMPSSTAQCSGSAVRGASVRSTDPAPLSSDTQPPRSSAFPPMAYDPFPGPSPSPGFDADAIAGPNAGVAPSSRGGVASGRPRALAAAPANALAEPLLLQTSAPIVDDPD